MKSRWQVTVARRQAAAAAIDEAEAAVKAVKTRTQHSLLRSGKRNRRRIWLSAI